MFGFAFLAYLQRQTGTIATERMMPELGLSQLQIGLFWAFMLGLPSRSNTSALPCAIAAVAAALSALIVTRRMFGA